MSALAASGLNLLNAAGVLAVIAAVFTGYVAIRKLGPEKNAIYISSAQGAAVIMDNLIATLREEVDRERSKSRSLALEVERLTAENERLQAANVALTRRRGSRHSDHAD